MAAYTFALTAVVCTALREVILRFAMRNGQDEWPILILYHAIAPVLLCVIGGVPSTAGADPTALLLLVVSSASWVLHSVCDLRAHSLLDAAVGSVLSTLNFVLIVLGGVFFFGERLSVVALLGAGLIVASAVRATRFPTSVGFSRGVRFKITSISVIAANMLLTKHLTGQLDSMLIAITAFVIPGVLYLALKPRQVLAIPAAVRQSRGMILLLPIVSALNYFSLVKALELGGVSITYSILQTSVVFVFIFGALLLGERENMMRRGVSCALCAVGAFVICNY